MSDSSKQTGISIPAALHQRVKALAVRERRTFSNMLTVLLEEALKQRQPKSTE